MNANFKEICIDEDTTLFYINLDCDQLLYNKSLTTLQSTNSLVVFVPYRNYELTMTELQVTFIVIHKHKSLKK